MFGFFFSRLVMVALWHSPMMKCVQVTQSTQFDVRPWCLGSSRTRCCPTVSLSWLDSRDLRLILARIVFPWCLGSCPPGRSALLSWRAQNTPRGLLLHFLCSKCPLRFVYIVLTVISFFNLIFPELCLYYVTSWIPIWLYDFFFFNPTEEGKSQLLPPSSDAQKQKY